MSSPRRRLGLRGELLALIAGALLLLILVSTFTLFAYRSALALLVDERRAEAARVAATVAEALPENRLPSAEELLRLAPGARHVALVDPRGATLVESGAFGDDEPAGSLLAPLGEQRVRTLDRPLGLGPDEALPSTVAAFAPVAGEGGRRFVRVDLAAGTLAPQLRSVRVLSAVVLAVNGALVVLLLLFFRHLITPFDLLLERARQLGGGQAIEAAEEDELAFLRRTLERAFAALSPSGDDREGAGAGEDDIASLRRTLAASLECGVLLLDREGAVVALNEIGAALLGVEVPPAEAGLPVGEAFRPHPELAALLTDAVAGRLGVRRRELVVETSSGRVDLGLTVHPLRRDDSGIRGYLALFADLTESQRRAQEARLAESLTGLGELAAGVAHELRNSLATLRGYLTLIERSPSEESITDYLGEIRHETDHLQRVLEDFLAFARPGTARLEAVDVLQLARRAAADPVLAGTRITIRDDRVEPAPLYGDPQLLERALRNLLHNAAEAIRDGQGERVEILISANRQGVELAVLDDGAGMSPEIRQRAFEPFATGRPGGVGLGLPLCRRIVALHGGSLEIADRSGGGTRATIRFPPDAFVTKGNDRRPSSSPAETDGAA